MNLKYAYTRLNVENYEACKLFYKNVLGLTALYENDAEEYAELDAGETKITILNRARLKEYIGPTEAVAYDSHNAKIALTFTVRNLDEAIAHLKSHGVVMINDPWQRPEDGLMQGGFITTCFRDPDGNLIEFEQILS
ncbi:VOC family protein [Altericista sp. CCNU0014]|uniref:VOC family protein n=1 Tax=Altericista sp. CCNU0014 TaxID=3082949 RepID=UPI00384BD72A